MISLGINFSSEHDASAAIAVDGKIMFAIAEERISRVKHDGSFPVNAISACLRSVGVTLSQVDHIVSGWPPSLNVTMNNLKNHATRAVPVGIAAMGEGVIRGLVAARSKSVARQLTAHFGAYSAKVRYLDHHYAHAISAYAQSGFNEAVVVVIDGRGAWEATSIWIGRGSSLTNVRTIRWPNSVGLLYATFTGFLGFEKYADEWKVMGLAPYGSPGVDLSPFVSFGQGNYNVRSDLLLTRKNGREYGHIEEFLGPARSPEEVLETRHHNIAYAVQSMCEEIECDVIDHAIKRLDIKNLCIAGGVGLNSKANGVFLQRRLMERIYIQPAAGDDGVALGAALTPAFERGQRIEPMVECYYGPSYSDEEIKRTLDTFKLQYIETDHPAEQTARLLADGALVGWFQGREEFGPRALGNRSILADPRYEENRDKVNMAVKFRESWRPFAPSVLAHACDDLFHDFTSSPFMILTFKAKHAAYDKVAAAIHIDGSARVQSVTKEQNPLYFELISEFERITGVPALLNTSFNLKGEAIVNTPFDAIRTFYTSGLDALVMGRYIVKKPL